MFNKIKEKLNDIYYKILESPLVEQLKLSYNSLSDRNKKVVNISFVIIIFLIIFLIFNSLITNLYHKEQMIKESSRIIASLDELVRINSSIQSKTPGRKIAGSKYVSLIDLIEKQEALSYIKDTSRVSIKEEDRKEVEGGKFYESRAKAVYNKITLRQFQRLLEGIEKNAITVNVDSLLIKRNMEDIRYIDVEFVLVERTPK